MLAIEGIVVSLKEDRFKGGLANESNHSKYAGTRMDAR